MDTTTVDDFIGEDRLRQCAPASNAQVISRIRPSKHAEEMYQLTREECAKGRMREAKHVPIGALLSPRFPVEQGVKENGDVKLRLVDDFSISHCNRATIATEKLKNDNLEDLE